MIEREGVHTSVHCNRMHKMLPLLLSLCGKLFDNVSREKLGEVSLVPLIQKNNVKNVKKTVHFPSGTDSNEVMTLLIRQYLLQFIVVFCNVILCKTFA